MRELGPTPVRFRVLNRCVEVKGLTAFYNHSSPIRFNLFSLETLILIFKKCFMFGLINTLNAATITDDRH